MAYANFITGLLNRLLNPHRTGEEYTNPIADQFLGLANDGQSQFTSAQQFNADQSQLDRDWQEKMYYIDREYQSPANQMRLYREAGLNPSLMYGPPIQTGQLGAGSEASSPSPSSSGLSSLLGLGSDVAMMPAQIELARSQARLNQEKAETEGSLRQARLDNLRSITESNLASVQDVISKIQQRVHQNALTDAERNNISFEQLYKSNQLSISWSRLQNETRMTDAQIDALKSEMELNLAKARVTNREYAEMVWTFAIRQAGLEKQNLLTDAQIKQAEATAAKLGFEGERLQQIMAIDKPFELYRSGKPSETGNPMAFEIRYSIGEIIKMFLGRL